MKWFLDLLADGYVLEVWKSPPREWGCIASHSDDQQDRLSAGNGPTLRKAVAEAVKRLDEAREV